MKKEFYHIHQLGKKDELWYEGSKILVDENFDSIMNSRKEGFSPYIDSKSLINESSIIKNTKKELLEYPIVEEFNESVKRLGIEEAIMSSGNTKNKKIRDYATLISQLEEYDPTAYLHYLIISLDRKREITKDDIQELKKVTDLFFQAQNSAALFKRETALEDRRQKDFIDKPSRLHSIYLADEEGIDYWINTRIKTGDYNLYKVLVDGNIFKGNEQLLPDERLSYHDTYLKAEEYWDPKSYNYKSKEATEYLVQGEIKVLKKIK